MLTTAVLVLVLVLELKRDSTFSVYAYYCPTIVRQTVQIYESLFRTSPVLTSCQFRRTAHKMMWFYSGSTQQITYCNARERHKNHYHSDPLFIRRAITAGLH
jgi:hypothetical protein